MEKSKPVYMPLVQNQQNFLKFVTFAYKNFSVNGSDCLDEKLVEIRKIPVTSGLCVDVIARVSSSL